MSSRLKSSWFNAGPEVPLKSKAASNYAGSDAQKIRLSFKPDKVKIASAEHELDDQVSARMDLDEVTAATSIDESVEELDHDEDEDTAVDFNHTKKTKGPDPSKEGADVIVIHPGSANLRYGLGSSILPRMIPHVIARKLNQEITQNIPDGQKDEALKYEVETYTEELEAVIKARMKAKKLRFVPNTRQLVHSFNEYTEAERIQDHNDPAKIEWLLPEEIEDAVLFGHSALLVAPTEDGKHLYDIRHPVQYGKLNWPEYKSREALICDLEELWTYALESELEIYKNDYGDYNVLLILPDTCEKKDMLLYIELLMNVMNFKSFSVMKESQCATFGSGVLTACVVDVGAQKTSIACIEDGYIIPTSIFKLNFGGNDITRIMWEIFQFYTQFPYNDIQLSRMCDFLTMESLKEYYGTMKEEDITVQLCECHIRVPRRETLKYKFKVFDDTMMAVIAPFYPKSFMRHMSKERFLESLSPIYAEKKTKQPVVSQRPAIHPLFGKPVELNSVSAEETSVVVERDVKQEAQIIDSSMNLEEDGDQMLPLDNAIVLSIASTSQRLLKSMKSSKRTEEATEMITLTYTDEERIKRLFNSILFVGGGLAKFPGASDFLRDQLFATFYHLVPLMFNIDLKASNFNLENVHVLANARSLDPQVISWKGGAIACRLDGLIRDCWVSNAEWKWYGEVLLKERVLFEWE